MTTSSSQRNSNTGLKLLDATSASIDVSATAVASEAFGTSFKLPSFTMTLKGANYAQILRCSDDYRPYLENRLKDLDKKKLTDNTDQIWTDAFGMTSFCAIAANFYLVKRFQDVGAKNGKFFYIIRPCVLPEYSKSGKNECGNKLALTPSITYQDSPSAVLANKLGNLYAAEGEYDAVVGKLYALADQLAGQKDFCQRATDAEYFSKMCLENTPIDSPEQGAACQSLAYDKNTAMTATWNMLIAAGASGVALGARALLIRKVKAPSFIPATLRSGLSGTIFGSLAAAGLPMIVFAATIAIRDQTKPTFSGKNYGSEDACAKVQILTEQIIKMKTDQLVENAQKKLVAASNDIKKEYDFFQGYTEATFGPNGKDPSASPTPTPSPLPSPTPQG